jgi:zinc transport system permease protein
MLELFSLHFFRNAFFMSFLLSILFGFLSFFIVLRKMAFLGAGIAHTAFGGVALGVLLGINPFYTSIAFCALSAILIGKLSKYGKISLNTGVGIFFSFAMALGALFISLKKDYNFDLSGYLFGNILSVTKLDLMLTIGVIFIFGIFLKFTFFKILFMTFDENVAAVSGVNTSVLDTCLLLSIALIIVVSIKIVGIVLVSALIVLPASTGLIFSNKYRVVLAVGIGFSWLILCGGLFLSYVVNSPAGSTIIILGTLIYFMCIIYNFFKKKD